MAAPAEAQRPTWTEAKGGYPSQSVVKRLSAAAGYPSALPDNAVRVVRHGPAAAPWTEAMWTAVYQGSHFEVTSVWCFRLKQACKNGTVKVQHRFMSVRKSATIAAMLSSENLNRDLLAVTPFVTDTPATTVLARWHGTRWWAIRTDTRFNPDTTSQLADKISREISDWDIQK